MAIGSNPQLSTPITATGKGTIPAAVQISGTITSSGNRVVGTSTKFTTELFKGDYIYNTTAATTSAVRKVLHILDDTHLILESGFPSDVSGINTYRTRGKYAGVSIQNSGAAAGKINEGDITIGASININASDGFSVDPISYDATGTTLIITPTL
jgi:hypothetical protein